MLSDEERKAIEHLTKKMEYHKNKPLDIYVWLTLDEHYVRIILNLIEKQQKEIEELKFKIGNEKTFLQLGEIVGEKKVEDKIKSKIEEIDKKISQILSKYGATNENGFAVINITNINDQKKMDQYLMKKMILQEILEGK